MANTRLRKSEALSPLVVTGAKPNTHERGRALVVPAPQEELIARYIEPYIRPGPKLR